LHSLPTQFQNYVPGTDVRVHVVGDEVFATEVISDALDYRYAHQTGLDVELVETTLDQAEENRCRRLAAYMGLPLCGIDLRRRPDGRFVCFEANPMPAFSFCEVVTGQPISAALVRLLDSARRS
jgi:glutathione synthase/RimK-type ligase-like ATP-grasp enzyme